MAVGIHIRRELQGGMALDGRGDLEVLLLISVCRKHSSLKIREEALNVRIRHAVCAHSRSGRLQRDADEVELGCRKQRARGRTVALVVEEIHTRDE